LRLAQDRRLQLTHLGAGNQPEFVVEDAGMAGVGLERLRRPTRPLQREHVQPTPSVGQRVGVTKVACVGERRRNPAERQ
jgi:hypothetical protein